MRNLESPHTIPVIASEGEMGVVLRYFSNSVIHSHAKITVRFELRCFSCFQLGFESERRMA